MIKKNVHLILIGLLLSSSLMLEAQNYEPDALFEVLRQRDSVLFEAGYNNCDFSGFPEVIHEDFEFFHDQAGKMEGKTTFIEGIKQGICGLPYKARRSLDEGSLEVFPLFNQGKLYGAIQRGKHRFWAKEDGKSEYLTSTAVFTHVWVLHEGLWQLTRVLSFDHQAPKSQE